MDTQPSAVRVTNSKGTSIVAVDSPKLPTFETYARNADGDGGIVTDDRSSHDL